MILLALTFGLVLIFFYDPRKFMYALMVFFVLFDMLDGFYEDQKIFAALRYLIPFMLILIYLVRESAFKRSDFVFLVLSFYLLMLLVYSHTDIIVSAKNLMAVLITLLMIPVGRSLGKRGEVVIQFEWFNRFLLVALPVYIAVANIVGFGESYTEAFTTGFLITSRMYIFPIVVFLALHYIISKKDQPKLLVAFDLVFVLVNVVIILINTRRTAMGMLVVAMMVYGAMDRKLILKMVVMGLIFAVTLIASYPLYEETLSAQLEKRERIQDLDTYEEEGRVLETIYIMDHHSRTQSIREILFGVKLFDTYEFGEFYFGRDRPIHSDFNMIFYSTGLVGLGLFGWFFLHYFLRKNRIISKPNRRIYFPILAMFVLVLFPGRFIGTLTYAPLLLLVLAAVKQRPAGLQYVDGPMERPKRRIALKYTSIKEEVL